MTCSQWISAALLAGACAAWAQTGADARRPAITGIAYVRFLETDMPAARAFYEQKLGLPSLGQAGGVETFAIGEKQRVEIAPAPTPAGLNRLDEVAFATPDVPAMERFLTAHRTKFEVISDREIRTHDPEGVTVGFVSGAMNPSGHPSSRGAGPAVSARRMIHAGFRVKDQGAEDKFYRELLGFRAYWHGGMEPGRTDWVSLQVPDGTDWIEYMLQYHNGADRREIGVLDHISLGVNKMPQATERLVANGWTDASTRKTQLGLDGKWQMNVFDPDQTRIEFMEFVPARAPCCSEFTSRHPDPDPEP